MNKLLSCHYNMDTNRVEARFADGTTLAIDCMRENIKITKKAAILPMEHGR